MKKKQLQAFVDRFHAKASKATQAKSKEKQIARLETVAVRKTLPNVVIKILPSKFEGSFGWRINNLAIGYGRSTKRMRGERENSGGY